MSKWKERFSGLVGRESIQWFDRSYIIDWIVATALILLTSVVEASPVFERDFFLDDPLISHPHTHQRISGYMNAFVAVATPLAIVVVSGILRTSLVEIHHGILSIYCGRALTAFVTDALKNRVGRLRPDFLSRCAWDAALMACTGNAASLKDGRRSFPSGHSSEAFTGMTFIALFIAGKTAAWCFRVPSSPQSLLASRFARFILTFIPLSFSTWVAVSRVEDYRHHKEDVVVGSLIGIISASICYLMYWPSPFAEESFTPENAGRPRMVYGDHAGAGLRNGEYQLTRLESDIEPV